MMLAAPKAMTFTSVCVDVIQMESSPWVEQFWVVTRPCGDSCYAHTHCPHWRRAVLSIGEWALEAEPEWAHSSDDGGEEYMISRVLVSAAQAPQHDHWAWEWSQLDDLVSRACCFLQMGLDLGHRVMVIARAETMRRIQVRPDFAPYVNRVHWWDVHEAIDTARTDEGNVSAESARDSAVAQDLVTAASQSKVWLFTEHLGCHDNWESAMAAERVINELVDQYDLAVACAVPDLSHQLGDVYSHICQHHARMVVV